jgi:DegV family protein with EDD domain
MLRIVTDSAGDMPPDWPERFDYQVIPVNIQFGEHTFKQGTEITDEEFYRIARETGVIPKTSQPTPHQFIEFYEGVAEPGDTILSIHVTSKLSGTFNSAVMAAIELTNKFNVIPFDSLAGSAALAFMCREAREMDRNNKTVDEILDRLRYIQKNINVILTLDTFEYAVMSGRVKAIQATVASLLNIKPIIDLKDGMLEIASRVRTRKRAFNQVLEMLQDRLANKSINAAVVHSLDPETAKSLMTRVEKRFNCHHLIMTELSIGVAANLGPGTIGIVAYPQ